MDFTTIAFLVALPFFGFLTHSIARALRLGLAPSIVRVGYTGVGPELSREKNPWLYWFSLLVMFGIWLAVGCALVSVVRWPVPLDGLLG